MASHVVVIGANARKLTVKTTPSKHLSDVLLEACSKFGLDPDQHGLKHNNKPVDLSRTLRLSGLNAGAKLDLVQASRSPSVITIALQLPAVDGSAASATAPARLTDKFPSNTPVWQILRRFESGAAGSSSGNYNFTQRATPSMNAGATSGSGRLCYAMPVVNVMGRELGSFADLQKTLAQMGLNGGSALLRLTFRSTDQPLEEAMAEISRYFASMEPEVEAPSAAAAAAPSAPTSYQDSAAAPDAPVVGANGASSAQDPSALPTASLGPVPPFSSAIEAHGNPTHDTPSAQSTSNPSSALAVFLPPTSTTPAAALIPRNETDYTPTVEHASLHQSRLAALSRPQRLPSDAELAAAEQARAAARAGIREVVVRLRFMDQSVVQRAFGRDGTVAALYGLVRDVMTEAAAGGVVLKVVGDKGAMKELVRESRERLIGDLGWQGRVLVNVVWAEGVGEAVRAGPVLREEYRAVATEMPKPVLPQDEAESKVDVKAGQDDGKKAKAAGGGGKDKEAMMRKFLGGLSRK